MTITDQIPLIDAQVAVLNLRINRALAHKERLIGQRLELDRKIAGKDDYLRRLGSERSKIATFEFPKLSELI